MPFLPPDHPHAAGKATRVLGERQGNVQSPPSSPSKSRGQRSTTAAAKASKDGATTKMPTKTKDGPSMAAKKSKSSTNLSAMFAKMNRSSKDLSTPATAQKQKDKENTTPRSSSSGPAETPIWAQFASSAKPSSRPSTKGSDKSSSFVADEIAKYTPTEYSPSKQRNFNGSFEQPSLRPALKARPQSAYVLGTEGLVDAIGRRLSGQRPSLETRRSEDAVRRGSKDEAARRVSGDRNILPKRASIAASAERKVSGSSTEQSAGKEKLTIAKRGARVMAAVAAFQGKSKGEPELARKEPEMDPKSVDEAFEAVLDSRQIPEPMRRKMRSLTLRVKADFIKQDQGSKTAGNSPTGTLADAHSAQAVAGSSTTETQLAVAEDDGKATKRSRPRSRTFTFSKSDKRTGDASPSKKQRSQSKSRPTSVYIPSDTANLVKSPSSATPTSPFASLGRKSHAQAIPGDYITYLRKHQDPVTVEVGRLHKLRILLRNETVAWVDTFLSLGGMAEIVGLLHRTMGLEWREEHEDQLLAETLLCLKGLCTTQKAMDELEGGVADDLFPALLWMLFDEEKKGPAEYCTRTVIVNVLCRPPSIFPSLVEEEQRPDHHTSQLPGLRQQLPTRTPRAASPPHPVLSR